MKSEICSGILIEWKDRGGTNEKLGNLKMKSHFMVLNLVTAIKVSSINTIVKRQLHNRQYKFQLFAIDRKRASHEKYKKVKRIK